MPLVQILVIEDDAAIRLGVCDALDSAGFVAIGVESGDAGIAAVRGNAFDLVLLDLVLPDQDGMRVMRSLREIKPTQAVIMLTARGDVQDRVLGLGLGADDYVVKPFNVAELLARVRAVLRRVISSSREAIRCELPSGGVVDFDRRIVILPEGRSIQLSEKENDLLRHLIVRDGQIVSRDELIEKVWGLNPRGLNTRTIDMHIARLREKIGDTHQATPWIVTVRGRGYALAMTKPKTSNEERP